MTHRGAPLLVIIAGVLWGTTGTVAHAIGDTVAPLTIGAVTMGVGGLILALVAGKGTRGVIADRSVLLWVILGGVGVAIYPLAFYTGMHLSGVAIGNILALGTGPLIGALLEWAIDRRPPGMWWWIATAVGIGGVVILSLGDHSGTTADAEFFGLGVGLALLAGVGYGVYSYAMGRVISAGHSALASAGSVFGAGSVPLLVVAVLAWSELSHAGGSWWGLSYLVAFPMVLSYILYSRALRSLSSSTVMTIALTEPAVATVMAVAVVGERFDAGGGLGLALIALAVVLGSFSGSVQKPAQST